MINSREAFEKAVADKWPDSYTFTQFNGNKDYRDEVLQGMWMGWQASRQALECEPAEYIRALQDAFDIIQADANTEQNYGSLCRISSVLANLKASRRTTGSA